MKKSRGFTLVKLLVIISVFFSLLLAGVAPGDSCLKSLWVDGVKKGTAGATAVLSKEYDRLTIGADGNRYYRYNGLVGQIDEFAIYAGVLDPGTIAAHASYSQGDANYVDAVLADNPLLYFRFEDAASPNGAPVLNTGSVARNGTYIGDDVYGDVNLVAGYIGNAADFNGASDGNGTCIDVLDDDDAFFPADGDVTIEFWANVPEGPNFVAQWFFQHTNGGNNGYGADVVYHGDTDYYLNYIRGGGSESPIQAETCEQWRHIVFTYDSEVTVQQDYWDVVKEDDPCLWLRFEDFNDPCDDSGHDYWVEYGDNTSIGPEGGGIGNCIYFPGGADNYAAAANQQTEPNTTAPEFGHQFGFVPGSTTFEFWYRSNSASLPADGATFFNQSYSGGESYINSPVYEMWNMGTGYTYSRYSYNNTGGGFGYANQSPGMQIRLDDAWHHIVFSWEEVSGTNSMNFRLCIDGISVKTATYTAQVPGLVGGDRGEMDHIVIGAGGWRDELGGGSTMRGYMDEFAIYDGILPMDRVIAHYEAGLPRTCQELWDRGLVSIQAPWALLIDGNKDCRIDFKDFASLAASNWSQCNDPCDPNCQPYPWE